MLSRDTIVCGAHFLAIVVIVRTIGQLIPWLSLCYFPNVVDTLVGVIIASLTLQFTKNRYLQEEVSPRNKAVVITGCDSGFGNALAKRLYCKGFQVFACCLFPEGPGAVQLQENRADKLKIVPLNVKSDESVRNAAEFVKNNLGHSGLWAVVNNAGIQDGFMLEFSTIRDFQNCMEVNAIGPVRVTKVFLPMLKENRGRVVNVTSLAGRISAPIFTAYCMSKFAAVSFTECLRREMDVWGIRAISIEPDFFQTPLFCSEAVGNRLEASMAEAGEDIQKEYGEEFARSVMKSKNNFLKLGSPDIHRVVDAMEAAILLEYPDIVYNPRASTFTRVLAYVSILQPYYIQDILGKIVEFVIGYPIPKGARK